MLMPNVFSVNVEFHDAPADLRHISLTTISFSGDHSLKKMAEKMAEKT